MLDIFLSTLSAFSIYLSIKLVGLVKIGLRDVIAFSILTVVFVSAAGYMFPQIQLIIAILISFITIYYKARKVYISIVAVFFSTIIPILVDSLQTYLLFDLLKLDKNYIVSNPITYTSMHLGLIVFSCIFSIALNYILSRLKIKRDTFEFNKNIALISLFNIIMILIIFYTVTILIRYYNISGVILEFVSLILLVYFVITIGVFYIFVYYNKKEVDYNNRRAEFENLKEYTTNLEALNNDMREFRHDYINILSSIAGYLDSDNLDGLKKYFDSKIVPLGDNMTKKNMRLSLLGNIRVTEIKGLLASKIIKAQELSIDTFVDIVEPIEEINMDIIDLCRSIGIILDNAIEAAKQCDKPTLKLALVRKKNSVVIVVINSFKGERPLINKIFEKGYSTKGENRGLGLSNLKEMVNSYKNVSLDTIINQNEFIQNIEISNS